MTQKSPYPTRADYPALIENAKPALRELLGAGSLFGVAILPETTNVLLFILPPGAFITLGYLIAIFNHFKKA